MKLYIKQKVFSFGGSFTVLDAYGNEKFFVRGETFSLGRRLHVYDQDQRELACIRQELLTWMPCYHVYVADREVAKVRREFRFFKPKYHVSGPDWEVDGHFLEHDYEITKNGRPVATVQLEWMTWGDSYELTIADPADALMVLCTVIAIDCVMESNDS